MANPGPFDFIGNRAADFTRNAAADRNLVPAVAQCSVILRAFKYVGGFYPFNWINDTRSGIVDGDTITGADSSTTGYGLAAVTELKKVYLTCTKISKVCVQDFSTDDWCRNPLPTGKLIGFKSVWRVSQKTGDVVDYAVYSDSTGSWVEFMRWTKSEVDGTVTNTTPFDCRTVACGDDSEGQPCRKYVTCDGGEDASYGAALIGCEDEDASCHEGDKEACPECVGVGYANPCGNCFPTGYNGVSTVCLDSAQQPDTYAWTENTMLRETRTALGTLLSSDEITYSDAYSIDTWLNDVSDLTTRFCSLPIDGSNSLPSGARKTTDASGKNDSIGCAGTDCTGMIVTPVVGQIAGLSGGVLADGISYDVLAGMPMQDLGGGAHTFDAEFDPIGGATNAAYWPGGLTGYTGDGLVPAYCAVINHFSWNDVYNTGAQDTVPCLPSGLIAVLVAAQQSQLSIDAAWLTANSADNFCIKQTFFSWDKPVNTGCADVCCQYYYYATATDQIGRDPTLDACTPDHTIGSESCITAASNNYGVWIFSTSGILAPGTLSNVGSDLRPGSPDPPHNAGGVSYIKFGTIGSPCCP